MAVKLVNTGFAVFFFIGMIIEIVDFKKFTKKSQKSQKMMAFAFIIMINSNYKYLSVNSWHTRVYRSGS